MSALPAAILSRFEDVVSAITGASPRRGFVLAPTRFTLDREPEGGIDGMFRVEATDIDPIYPFHGSAEFRRNAPVAVFVRYFRGGGDVGGGDRRGINRAVVDDMMKIIDACEDSETYDSDTTGIRVVHFRSFTKVADMAKSEIWQAVFDVEWQSISTEVAA